MKNKFQKAINTITTLKRRYERGALREEILPEIERNLDLFQDIHDYKLLEECSYSYLYNLASELGVPYYTRKSKAELIRLVKDYQQDTLEGFDVH